MTDLTITEFGDAWVNDDKETTNYGSSTWIRVKSGVHRGFLLPTLPNIAGRTVVSATLVGHASQALAAQTLTICPATERWQPGKVTSAKSPAVDTGENVAVAIGATAIGGTVSWTVTDHIQAVADGTDWFGWRITTGSSSANQAFYAFDSGQPAWELHVTLSDVPDQPTDLRPDGGDVEALDVLSWIFSDAGLGTTGQAKSRVQVDTPTGGADPDEVSPDYDSGLEDNVAGEWDLTGEHTVVGAGPHYWRVLVRDSDGNESAWSDWAEVSIDAMPTLVMDSPTGAFGDPTPTIAAHLTGGTVASWSAFITGPDRSDVRYRLSSQTGAVSFQVPLKNKEGRRILKDEVPGWLYLRVYPVGDWVSAVGQQTYVDTWVELTWDDDLGVEAPTDLAVFQTVACDAKLRWAWKRTEAADEGWIVQVDGVTVARLDPEDVDLSGGVYYWEDGGQVSPLRPHTLAVRAAEDGQRSEAVEVIWQGHTVKGVWIIPDADIDPILIEGTSVGDFTRTDYRANYVTANGSEVDVFYGTPGRKAPFTGVIDARDGATSLWERVASLETLQESPVRTGRLVWGSQSCEGRFRDVDVTSNDDLLPTTLNHKVRFEFVEVLG